MISFLESCLVLIPFPSYLSWVENEDSSQSQHLELGYCLHGYNIGFNNRPVFLFLFCFLSFVPLVMGIKASTLHMLSSWVPLAQTHEEVWLARNTAECKSLLTPYGAGGTIAWRPKHGGVWKWLRRFGMPICGLSSVIWMSPSPNLGIGCVIVIRGVSWKHHWKLLSCLQD